MGLDLFFPKQMQENLKVRKPMGEDLFVLIPKTRVEGMRLGILREARASAWPWAFGHRTIKCTQGSSLGLGIQL